MLFSNETYLEVKKQLRIYDVVSDYVSLIRKSDKNYFGQCPFHEEKSASFSVSVKDNLFYCFGCGAGGDAIKFYQDFNKVDFKQAVLELAQKKGIPVKLLDDSQQEEYNQKKELENKIYEMVKLASEFYHFQLRKNFSKVESFLKLKNINSDSIDKFKLGYASDQKDALYNYFLERIPEYQEFYIESGLFKKTENNNLIDFFRNRIIIPIKNSQGKVVAFGGRTLSNDSKTPKYINSPETILFNKSETVFGLDIARDAVKRLRTLNYVILTEGYFDVIALHQIGFINAVACMGTAVTPFQIKQILKCSNKVFLSLDCDDAGMNATKKLINSLDSEIRNELIDLKIVQLKQKDSSDFISVYGKNSYDEFNKVLQKSKNWIDWYTEFLIKDKNLNENSIVKQLFYQFLQLLEKISDIERIKYIQHFSEILSNGNHENQSKIYQLFVDKLNSKEKNKITNLKHKNNAVDCKELTNSSEVLILKIYLNYINYRKFIKLQMLYRNLSFCIKANRDLWILICEIEGEPDNDDYDNFKFDDTLIGKLKNNNQGIWDKYFELDLIEKECVDKAIVDVILMSFNYIEKKILEKRIKIALDLWKKEMSADKFALYQSYFQQLQDINQAIGVD